jgi:ketosteroid isomerase-like protein
MVVSRLLFFVITASLLADTSPNPGSSEAQARTAIEAAIARSLAATRNKDIDAFMASIPDNWSVVDSDGKRIDKKQLRANTLRDWKIISRTIAIEEKIESLKLESPTPATVFTSQHWERMMYERDGKTQDHVVTTQRHRETWRRDQTGWKAYDIQELGGKVWVNGKLYEPRGNH